MPPQPSRPAPRARRVGKGGPLAGVFRSPEMQLPTHGKVASAGARRGSGEGAAAAAAAGGGEAALRAQRGPGPAASPPLTLGLRLHPSPRAAREEGWPGARGELAGRLRSRGPGGRISERKTQGQRSAPKKPAFQLPRLLREPSRVLGRLRFTARPPPPRKSCTDARRKPPPLG